VHRRSRQRHGVRSLQVPRPHGTKVSTSTARFNDLKWLPDPPR
jgi:hypothetical protein